MIVKKSNRDFLKLFLLTLVFLLLKGLSFAQPILPQRTITVSATQAMHFGTLCLNGTTGGSVTLGYNGVRTSSDIYLSALAPAAQPAIFEIKLCEGRNVIITYSPTITLTGSNGGSFELDIGPTEYGVSGSSFPVISDCNFITPIRVGGTLHIPDYAPAGIYTGSFDIIFEQE